MKTYAFRSGAAGKAVGAFHPHTEHFWGKKSSSASPRGGRTRSDHLHDQQVAIRQKEGPGSRCGSGRLWRAIPAARSAQKLHAQLRAFLQGVFQKQHCLRVTGSRIQRDKVHLVLSGPEQERSIAFLAGPKTFEDDTVGVFPGEVVWIGEFYVEFRLGSCRCFKQKRQGKRQDVTFHNSLFGETKQGGCAKIKRSIYEKRLPEVLKLLSLFCKYFV